MKGKMFTLFQTIYVSEEGIQTIPDSSVSRKMGSDINLLVLYPLSTLFTGGFVFNTNLAFPTFLCKTEIEGFIKFRKNKVAFSGN